MDFATWEIPSEEVHKLHADGQPRKAACLWMLQHHRLMSGERIRPSDSVVRAAMLGIEMGLSHIPMIVCEGEYTRLL